MKVCAICASLTLSWKFCRKWFELELPCPSQSAGWTVSPKAIPFGFGMAALRFDGNVEFGADRAGEFTGTSVINQEFHVEEISNNITKDVRLELHRNNERVVGVNPAVVTLSQGYQPRHPDAPPGPVVAADGPFSLTATW